MLPYHSALRAFILTAAHHQRPYPPELLHSGDEADPEGTILKFLQSVDLETRIIHTADVNSLTKLGGSFPVLVKRATDDWIIVVDITGNPAQGYGAFVVEIANEAAGIQQLSFATLAENWGSVVILCSAKKRPVVKEKAFGFGWFFDEILKYKRYFRDIAIASLVLSLLGLVTPLLFNIIVDKVIPHRTYQTLYVIAAVAALTAGFEGMFGYLIQT